MLGTSQSILSGRTLFSYNNNDDSIYIGPGSFDNSILKWVLIPANTFLYQDVINIQARFNIEGDTSHGSIGLYINTTNSLDEATLLGENLLEDYNIQYGVVNRTLMLKENTTELVSTTMSLAVDNFNTLNRRTILNIDWSKEQYVLCTGSISNGEDIMNCSSLSITQK